MRRATLHRCESLEPRLALAGVVTFTDVDGDLVTVRTSLGTNESLQAAMGLVPAGGMGGHQLRRVVLTDPAFAGTRLRITALPGPGGDGQVHVGEIASNQDLGAVTVRGDLGVIFAGDAILETPGVASLVVASIGRFGIEPMSMVNGSLPVLRVGGDVTRQFGVNGRAVDVEIGGSIDGSLGAAAFGATSVGRIMIGGSIRGGSTDRSGLVQVTGMIDELVVGGSLEGGDGDHTGVVFGGGLGTVRIAGSLVGGLGGFSGSVIGGSSGITRVEVGSTLDDGVHGSKGQASGGIASQGAIGSIVVSGSVTGGIGRQSGLLSGQRIDSIDIGGELVGGQGSNSGSVSVIGRLGTLGVKSIVAGAGPMSGAVMGRLLGDIIVRRDIIGTATRPVLITGVGSLSPAGARAIDSLWVGGTMSRALVLGGYQGAAPQNGAARVGSVTVQGTMRASSIVAGVQSTAFPSFGSDSDRLIDGAGGSRIESVVVNGAARGSGNPAEVFGVVANSIGSVRLGGRIYAALPTGISPAGDNLVIRSIPTPPAPLPARPL